MWAGLIGFFVVLLTRASKSSWLPISLDNKSNYCEIKMRIYDSCDSSRYEEFCIEQSLSLFRSPLYNKSNCNTFLIALPFLHSVTHPNVQTIVRAVASKCRYNIIVMDNSIHTKTDNPFSYPFTMFTDYKDSERYAKALNDAIAAGLLRGECLVAVGFSLGAQAVGQVCRLLSEKCGQLYAIDPAGPLYLRLPVNVAEMEPVSKSDACHVVLLECNRYMLGTPLHTAHVNIIVNNGLHQPSCPLVTFPCNFLCSHIVCNLLFADAIRRPGECVATSNTDPGVTFPLDFPSTTSCGENYENSQERIVYLDTATRGQCLEPGEPRNIMISGGYMPAICSDVP